MVYCPNWFLLFSPSLPHNFLYYFHCLEPKNPAGLVPAADPNDASAEKAFEVNDWQYGRDKQTNPYRGREELTRL